MQGVTVGGPGLVAVGGAPVDGDAAVWVSEDGLVWSRVPHDDAVFSGDAFMADITPGGPGLVAVGHAGNRAAVWTSEDGLVWSRVPHEDAVFGGEANELGGMASVTAGGPGLVAVGHQSWSPDVTRTGSGDAAVWTSEDGLSWSRVPHDEVNAGADQHMFSVISTPVGLVAVGTDGLGPHAAVWVALTDL